MLISFCCSPRNAEEDQHVLMFLGITRAHPHCEMKRKLRVELLPEDPRSADPNVRGLLVRCLYGCRGAGQISSCWSVKRWRARWASPVACGVPAYAAEATASSWP
eukprot:8692692-Pyramimonas_sp.AAC.1